MLSRKNMPLDAMRHASCFTLKRVAALLLVGMLPAVCPAEEYVDLQTDRDAFTPSTYTTKPGTNPLDTKCAPFSESIVDRCSEPTREEAMSGLSLNKPGSQFFPKER